MGVTLDTMTTVGAVLAALRPVNAIEFRLGVAGTHGPSAPERP